MNFINEAFAMAGQSQGAPGGGLGSMLFFFILMILILYLMIWRPQRKRQMEHQKFVSALQKGDEVITDSGIVGKITGIADKLVTLEVADNVRIKIIKGRIMGPKKHLDEPAKAK